MSHLRYFKTVVTHKWWVLVAGLRVGVPLGRLLVHDKSKFSGAEWPAYARKFGGSEDVDEEAFGAAVQHHYDNNDHHWQHWVETVIDALNRPLQKPHPMPEAATREMVADWMGASRAYSGTWDAHGWYATNRDQIVLAWQTRERVEELLEQLER